MTWEELTSQSETKYVTNRYKVTQAMDSTLREIEDELNIPPSAIVRLALNCFLPKVRDSHYKYEGIRKLWDDNKF